MTDQQTLVDGINNPNPSPAEAAAKAALVTYYDTTCETDGVPTEEEDDASTAATGTTTVRTMRPSPRSHRFRRRVGGGYVTVDAAGTASDHRRSLTCRSPTRLSFPPPAGRGHLPGRLGELHGRGGDAGDTVDVDVYFYGTGAPDAYFKFHDNTSIDFSTNTAISGNVARAHVHRRW